MRKSRDGLRVVLLTVIILMLIIIAALSSVLIVYNAKNTMSYDEYVMFSAIRNEQSIDITIFNETYEIDTSFMKTARETINKYPSILSNETRVLFLGYSYIEQVVVDWFS